MLLIEDTAYKYTTDRRSYCGLLLNAADFGKYMATTVNSRFYDCEGTRTLERSVADMGLTTFESKVLKGTFRSAKKPRDWEIGEKIAECFLGDYRDSTFPYNGNRDYKDPDSSLPGTDLVGFARVDGKTMFLFCEVKTSDQKRHPPSVVHGKGGLTEQLAELKRVKKRQELVRWLGLKVFCSTDGGICETWQQATLSYARHSEFKISGVMVRGVAPDERDLKSAFDFVLSDMESGTYFELLALYIPIRMGQYAEAMGPGK